MCGIIGFFKRRKEQAALGESVLAGMQRAMIVQKHRGPDDDGVCAVSFGNNSQEPCVIAEGSTAKELSGKYFDGILGFNRLSIKDLSMNGHQPMLSDCKKVILVFNGEIYNDQELRKSLLEKGYQFKSTTDTEVILKLYQDAGFDQMIRKLNGMYGLAIVDLRTRMLYMARDRFGIKPLYYSVSDTNIIFASELKCLIQFDEFEKQINMDAFNSRIMFPRPSNQVLLKGAELVGPGQALRISLQDGSVNKQYYYSIDAYERTASYADLDDAIDALDSVLKDAIRRQLISDVKVGCQVSGGIDSTIVSYYANQEKKDNLKDGVSIIDGFGDKGEDYYINQVGDKLDINLHQIKLTTDDFIDNYEKLVWHNDSPLYKPYFAAFYVLMREGKKHVTVLMSGEGADELAGGYSRFGAGMLQPFVGKLQPSPQSGITSYSSFAEYAVMSDATIAKGLFVEGYDTAKLIEEQVEMFNSFSGSNFTKQLKYEILQKLPESFLRQDKMSMANSIENRVPLVDNQVVDYFMTCPEQYLLQFVSASPVSLSDNPFNWIQGKYVLKELCARVFGRDFAYRKKAIMVFDDRTTLSSNGFQELFYDSIYPGMKRRGLVDADIVKNWYENIRQISIKEFNNMWRVIGLENWCQIFMDKKWGLL